jgi:UDP-N-acetylmuramyl pentapeptide phosphotransferase/UDP-N-acetylglucosamine-1-phosphate transferase
LNETIFYIAVFIVFFLLTAAGVETYRRWSLSRGILDHPNERSSHEAPTPRGAGLVIFVVCLAGYVAFGIYGLYAISWGYVGGAVVLAVISWLDDLVSLSFILRLIALSAAALLLIADAGYVASVDLPLAGVISLGVAGPVLTFIWIVGFLNAFNFMDGIDGIAGSQGFVAAVGWFGVGLLLGSPLFEIYGCLIAASTLGFLVFNWQPAKIFMGDVGSCFLGFTLAAMPLLDQVSVRPKVFLAAVAFVWPFVFDSVFTFFRRLFSGQKVWRPHREHIYQQMIISGTQHYAATLIYAFIATTGVAAGLLFLAFDGKYHALVILYYAVAAAVMLVIFVKKKE